MFRTRSATRSRSATRRGARLVVPTISYLHPGLIRQKRRGGQSFFNYCKTVLYHARQEAGDLLVAETQSLEAEVRFFAGTYYALFNGVWIVCVSLVTQLALHPSALVQFRPPDPRTSTLYPTVLLLIAMYLMKRAILKRFRTLRIKEVDTLLDAFYLVHRHARSCPECSAKSPDHG